MISFFDDRGLLPEGIHEAMWDEFEARFGTNPHRQQLLTGLKAALESLAEAGCRAAYIDGSLVSAKEVLGNFDACWDTEGVDYRAGSKPKLLCF